MSVYGECIYQEFQLLAAEGHVALYTNPRGSRGYGEDYDNLTTFMEYAGRAQAHPEVFRKVPEALTSFQP